MEDQKELTLQLTIEETNVVLEALGQLPFKTVFGLISKIQSQASQQLNANGSEAAAKSPQPGKTAKPTEK